MSSISVNINEVRNLSGSLRRCTSDLINVRTGVNSLRYSIDSKVLARRNINGRISSICSSISDLESKLRKLDMFIDNAMANYSSADNKITNLFNSKILGINSTSGSSSDSKSNSSQFITSWDENKNQNTIDKILSGNDFKKLGRDSMLLGAAGINPAKLLMRGNKLGLKFSIVKHDGSVFLKLKTGKVSTTADYGKIRKLMQDNLGSKNKWDMNAYKDLGGDGVKLYDSKTKVAKSSVTKYTNTNFKELNNTINSTMKNIGKTKLSVFKGTLKSEFFNGINLKNVAKDAKMVVDKGSKLTKFARFSKGAGILGTALTIGTDAYEDFHSKSSNPGFNAENVKNFGIDAGVDLSTCSAAMATGAAIGSLVVPPIGTLAGVILGVGISTAINVNFMGSPPKSLVGGTKEFIKHPIKSLEGLGEGINSKMSEIFW